MIPETGNHRTEPTPFALTLASVLFLIPIGLLGVLFFQESRKDIKFVEKEIAGVEYAQTVWPILNDVVAGRDANQDVAARRWDPIRAASETEDFETSTLETRKALAKALSRSDDEKDSKAEILMSAAALINNIDDVSNLTLDPDLQSFYLIDSGTLLLPELAVQTGSLRNIDLAAATGPTSDAAKFEANVNAARIVERFHAALAGFDNSVDAAARVSKGQLLHPAVSAARRNIDALAASVVQRAAAATPGQTGKEPSNVNGASNQEFALAETEYWDASTRELQRILNVRRNDLVFALWTKLLTVAAFSVAAFAAIGGVAFTANRGIDRIVKAFRRK